MRTDLSIILISEEENDDLSDVLDRIFNQKSAANYDVICVKKASNKTYIPDQYKQKLKIIDANSIPAALNKALGIIDSTYLTFLYSSDIWNETLVPNLLTSIKQQITDCVIYGVNLNKKYSTKNINPAFLNFKNFSKKLQEEVFLVSEIGKTIYNMPEFINNKIYRYEFLKENDIYFQNDENYAQIFHYKFMYSNPKFIFLNNYLSRIIAQDIKNPIAFSETIEKMIDNSKFDDDLKDKLHREILMKNIQNWINYSTPYKGYKEYNKKVKDKIKELLDSKKIYEYELKMNTFYVRYYKFMNTNFLSWYFWWNKHCIK